MTAPKKFTIDQKVIIVTRQGTVDGTVTKVGTKLVTVKYDRGYSYTSQFYMDTGDEKVTIGSGDRVYTGGGYAEHLERKDLLDAIRKAGWEPRGIAGRNTPTAALRTIAQTLTRDEAKP